MILVREKYLNKTIAHRIDYSFKLWSSPLVNAFQTTDSEDWHGHRCWSPRSKSLWYLQLPTRIIMMICQWNSLRRPSVLLSNSCLTGIRIGTFALICIVVEESAYETFRSAIPLPLYPDEYLAIDYSITS